MKWRFARLARRAAAGDRASTQHLSAGFSCYRADPVDARRARVFVEGGIPADRIIHDMESGNSWQEAVNARRLMEARGRRAKGILPSPSRMLSLVAKAIMELMAQEAKPSV